MVTSGTRTHPVASGDHRRRAGGRLTVLFGAIATLAALFGGPAQASSAVGNAPAPAVTVQTPQAQGPEFQRLCPPSAQPGVMSCLSVVRADSLRAQPATGALPQGYGPAALKSAYKLSNASAGTGKLVAVVDAFNAPNAESDLAVYRKMYGLPACTTANGCFKKVNQGGEQGHYPPSDPGWAGEISLDLQMVSATCPKCHILLVEADDNYTNNLGASVNTAVGLGATYVSNSYGGKEFRGETTFDRYYHHDGVVVTASTGDSGYGAQYPAASPYVTAVGGTSLTRHAGARGWAESAWKGAGSGCSAFEAKPAWQNVNTGCPRRALADVSAVADPETGVAVYFTYGGSGGWWIFGGTSVSSPIIASMYALAGTPGSKDAPASYPYAHTGNLYDVTSGSNGSCSTAQLCHARKGWDGPTGLGTPNGSAALKTPGAGTWSGPVKLGMGPLGSAPAAAVSSDGHQYVFWKGSDGKLSEATWDGATWTGPVTVGTQSIGSQPTAGVDGTGHVYVYWKGTDSTLQQLVWDGSSWVGPTDLGMGTLSSAPAAAVGADGQQYVFWKGSDGKLVEAHWNLTKWIGPTQLGYGSMGSQPTAGVDGANHLYVFWKGTDGLLKQAYWTGAWHSKSLGMGPLGSAPATAVSANGHQYVLWVRSDGTLQEALYTGTWSGPIGLGMAPVGAPPTVVRDSLNRMYAYWNGKDGSLMQARNLP